MEREDVLGNVRRNEGYFHEQLTALTGATTIVGDVRGTGYFKSLELVKDRETRETFSAEECDVLLREFLSPAAASQAGVICRADDRGDPVIQLSPPLIARASDIDEAVARARRGAAARRETHANRLGDPSWSRLTEGVCPATIGTRDRGLARAWAPLDYHRRAWRRPPSRPHRAPSPVGEAASAHAPLVRRTRTRIPRETCVQRRAFRL